MVPSPFSNAAKMPTSLFSNAAKKPTSLFSNAAKKPTSCSKKHRPAVASPPPTAQTVHPARRLTSGTAVSVRTRYVNISDKCCLVLWLPARVVSASGAFHYAVKYAADLHPMFASKVVRLPVEHVREGPRRASSSTAAAAVARP